MLYKETLWNCYLWNHEKSENLDLHLYTNYKKDSERFSERKFENVRQEETGMKFGERLMQTYSFYYQSCLFVGSHTETTSRHFQLPNENNMFVWEKK